MLAFSEASPLTSSDKAFLASFIKLPSLIFSSLIMKHLDISALLTSKYGFSVVAPMSVTVESSTYGSKKSCWALLNLCISSTKSMVFLFSSKSLLASSTAFFKSLTPLPTALILMKFDLLLLAITLASEVFPVPAGPYSISEGSLSALIALYRKEFLLSTFSWPM